MEKPPYFCDINAEPLHRYRKGGFHPVHLGDVMHDGRYRIMHKLGWGGWSTVWAARDQRDDCFVAIKISAAESNGDGREIANMKTLSSRAPDCQNFVRILNHFRCAGPNGDHDCFVLDLLGPSVANLVDRRCTGNRLPGRLAKRFAKDAFEGLATLHGLGIAHGDLHVGNLALGLPILRSIGESELMSQLGEPEVGAVKRRDGTELSASLPKYLVMPTSFPINLADYDGPIKIVDFGESFQQDAPPKSLHTPLPVRAPEVIFEEKLTMSVDLWSAACMLYELVVGQPPFDSIMVTKPILVSEMIDMATDELPDRWKPAWNSMKPVQDAEEEAVPLQAWLNESYFDGERPADLSQADIARLGELVQKMLYFEPSSRIPAAEIAQDPWFLHA